MGYEPRQPASRHAALVKICGLTDPDEARLCARLGADWIGLNFHRPSPRFVDEPRARTIAEALPAGCQAVGLFVNRPADEVLRTARRIGLEIVQLHGDEPAEDVRALQEAGLRVVRAFRLRDPRSVAVMAAWLMRAETLQAVPEAILVDAHSPAAAGGTGRSIPDDVLDLLPASSTFSDMFGERSGDHWVRVRRLILAGGLTPENVAPRIARVQPWMVDTASGVESSPGRKDPTRVAAFIAAARGAAPPPEKSG
jgi:phosphoribosylanthranilate isomerase